MAIRSRQVWDTAKVEHIHTCFNNRSADNAYTVCTCGWKSERGHWYHALVAGEAHLKSADTYCFGCDDGHVHRSDCSA